jgi:hypothetical protein
VAKRWQTGTGKMQTLKKEFHINGHINSKVGDKRRQSQKSQTGQGKPKPDQK